MLDRPIGQFSKGPNEGASKVCQRVLDRDWHGRKDSAGGKAISLKVPQGLREHALGDSFNATA